MRTVPFARRTVASFYLLLALWLAGCTGGAENVAPTATTANDGAAAAPPTGTAIISAANDVPPAVVNEPGPGTATAPANADPATTPSPAPTDGAPAVLNAADYAPVGIAATTFPGRAGDLAVSPAGTVYLVTAEEDKLYFHRSGDGGRTFATPLHINPGAPYKPTSLGQPIILPGRTDRVNVAWLQIVSGQRSILWAVSSGDDGRSFAAPQEIDQQTPRHGLLLNGSSEAGGGFLLSWLQYGQLFFAAAPLPTSGRLVDELVCDCCQPGPLWHNGQLFIAYRNLEETDDGRQIRNIFLLRSDDGGDTFRDPVPISDADWYLESCPTAGPSLAAGPDGRLYASFMDGRADDGSLTRADVFVATSDDGGQSFGPNVGVHVPAGYNKGSTIAVGADGAVHVSWQSFNNGRQNIFYTVSVDRGASFSPAWLMVQSEDGSGRGHPHHPQLVVGSAGDIHLLWLDRLGVHHVTW